MEGKKLIKCSLCGETTHNKRTCPRKPIDNTFMKDDNNDNKEEYVVESITILPKRSILIKDLLDKQDYDINSDIFEAWLHSSRSCPLKEIKYTMDKGLNKESIMLYLRIVGDIDSYY